MCLAADINKEAMRVLRRMHQQFIKERGYKYLHLFEDTSYLEKFVADSYDVTVLGDFAKFTWLTVGTAVHPPTPIQKRTNDPDISYMDLQMRRYLKPDARSHVRYIRAFYYHNQGFFASIAHGILQCEDRTEIFVARFDSLDDDPWDVLYCQAI